MRAEPSISRRTFTAAAGSLLAMPAVMRLARAHDGVAHIGMKSDEIGAHVWFDPVGLLVEPGTVIEWTLRENVHTATAYHPANDRHSLRIPESATPWDSGFLVEPGSQFSVTLTEPGVYDYYCAPHEAAGMVGRIIVGEPSGPGAQPYDYFLAQDPRPDWQSVPQMAQDAFPSIADIMDQGRVAIG